MKAGRVSSAIALLALLAAASPAAAQLYGDGAGMGGQGVLLSARIGGSWTPEAMTRSDRKAVGRVGSGVPIDGLSARHELVTDGLSERHEGAPFRLQVQTAGGWLPWVDAGVKTGVAGKPITGIRLTAGKLAVRYRGSFVGKGVGDWALDGAPIGAGGAPLEALEVELLEAAASGTADLEYRVFFSGTGWSPWARSGVAVEGPGTEPRATAVQVRGGLGVLTEVSLQGTGWRPTTAEGEPAGDPSGVRSIGSLRFFCDFPLRYRVLSQLGAWGPWQKTGEIASPGGAGLRVAGVTLELKRPDR